MKITTSLAKKETFPFEDRKFSFLRETSSLRERGEIGVKTTQGSLGSPSLGKTFPSLEKRISSLEENLFVSAEGIEPI